MKKILVIDDDEELNQLLKKYLAKFSYEVRSETHPHDGLKAIKRYQPDLIILDVMLPDMEGFEVLREIRKESAVQVVMLTARGEVTDRIVGLEIGADDYLPKPFEPRELVARIQTVLRRGVDSGQAEIKRFGRLTVNFKKHSALVDSRPIDLTTAEFEILALFVHNEGRVLDRDQLLDHLRGIEWDVFSRSVDVLVSRLRKKLEADHKNPQFIKTVRGTGYMFIGNNDND